MSRLAPLYAALELSGILGVWRTLRPGRLVLCYHNVLARGDTPRGDASLHMPREKFEAQLDWVMRHYQVSTLSATIAEPSQGTADPRPLAAITFDDAYCGVLRHALPALRERKLPATIFVTTKFSDSPRHFWWDLIASLRPRVNRLALRDAHGGRSCSILASTGLSGDEEALPADYLPAEWSALRASVDSDLSFGAHTRSHPMLTRQSEQELEVELSGVVAEVERKVGNAVPVLAYPYGDVDDRVADVASRAGYRAGVTISPMLISSHPPLRLPRLNVPAGIALPAFRAEASGLRFRRTPG